jgi:putative pyruvate formate lyase activating enzyme
LYLYHTEDGPLELEHYLSVRDGRRAPRFMRARSLVVPSGSDPWQRHAEALARFRAGEADDLAAERETVPPLLPSPSLSLLDLKIELAHRALYACDLCPHHCRVNRNRGQTGYCGVAAETAVHWEGILHGEEIELVPSHELFLSGCTMRCAFCYSHEAITRPMTGRVTTPGELAAWAGARNREGARSLNLVGGEPTVHIPTILRALRLLDRPLPVVWNSNMYATAEAMALLDGVVDLFLGDIHFGTDACARRLGRIPDYLPSVTAAFHAAAVSGASVIIRHLVMPGHLECCARPAMEWAASALPDVPFHLMFQYLPDYRAEGDPVLGRTLTPQEIVRARRMAAEIGVKLYRETRDTSPVPGTQDPAGRPAGEPIGETVDILIHDDGRVSFTRLLEALLPVAAALNPKDQRVAARGAGPNPLPGTGPRRCPLRGQNAAPPPSLRGKGEPLAKGEPGIPGPEQTISSPSLVSPPLVGEGPGDRSGANYDSTYRL